MTMRTTKTKKTKTKKTKTKTEETRSIAAGPWREALGDPPQARVANPYG